MEWKIQVVIASTGWSWYNNVDDIDDELLHNGKFNCVYFCNGLIFLIMKVLYVSRILHGAVNVNNWIFDVLNIMQLFVMWYVLYTVSCSNPNLTNC